MPPTELTMVRVSTSSVGAARGGPGVTLAVGSGRLWHGGWISKSSTEEKLIDQSLQAANFMTPTGHDL